MRDGNYIELNDINYKNITIDKNNILGSLGIFNFVSKTTRIGYVEPGSPAFNSGFLNKDKIISINGNQVNNWSEIVDIIQKNPEKFFEFLYH